MNDCNVLIVNTTGLEVDQSFFSWMGNISVCLPDEAHEGKVPDPDIVMVLSRKYDDDVCEIVARMKAAFAMTTVILGLEKVDSEEANLILQNRNIYHIFTTYTNKDDAQVVIRNAAERKRLLLRIQDRVHSLEKKQTELQGLKDEIIKAFV